MQKTGSYIIEMRQIGNSVKVSAIDPVTYKEACITVPATGLSKNEMVALAVRKLEFILKK